MAQSGSVQDSVGVDRQPPSGATAFSDAPMSSSRQFRIHWRGGDDGNGSGLSGEYRIQYRVNGGPWIIWIDKTTARDSLFSGSQNQFYEFEAAAYDRVGFVEPFNGIAETSVLVNIYASDKTPPAAPTNLLANGANPSPWQSLSEFTIRWNTPKDESGIESSFWKLGSAPTSNNDYNQKSHPLNPVTVSVTTDGTVPFYVWLADSAGNVDYRNHATIDLRRDSVLPVVQTIAIDTPLPAFVQDNVIPWYNSQSMKSYTLSSTFVEKYPEQGVLTTDGLTDSLFNQGAALGSGEIKKTTFQFAIQNPADRIYTLKTAIIDSASNKGSKSLKIGMDGTAPFGSMAASPVVSATDTFTVRWSAGSDDNGSGIISYRIFSRTQTMPWVLWFEAPAAGKKAFTGQNGVTYYFESRAVDHVGLVEAAGASAETATRIDFSANDREAPPPPNNLRANGGAPASPWTANSAFIISWSNPQDASGIAGSLWKLGNAPVSNSDTSGIGGKGPANGPMTVTMNTTGKQWLYVWLIDGKGNVNYLNTARVQLRFDNQSPKFTQAFLHPGYGKDWFSPVQQSGIELQIIYQEQYPDSLSIRSDQLGFSLKTTELKSGNAVEYIAPFSIAGKPDGMALLYTSLCDSARNKTSFTDTIKIDSTPPIGASASSPQISGTASFVVNWSSGTDAGVGVADIFDLFVRVDQGQWNLWKSNFVGRSVTYTGENGKSYGFEVLARDLLGNKEQQTFVAESTTRVDFSVADSTAPAAPINLRAGDANPSPWQKFRTFSVAWQQPQDPSGIARALFKLGTPPVSSFDTTASTKGVPPVSIRASQENGQMLYIWLVDGAGNTDHHNTAAVLLRYDATVPIIDSLNLVDSFGHHKQWFSPLVAPHQAVLKTFYREKSLARIHLEPSTLFTAQDIFPPVSGNSADFNLFFKDFPDGHIDFTVTVYDSAGNQVQAAKRLSLDATPPQNTVAQSPDSTAPGEFLVTWDPKTVIEQGSGLSGEYDIRLQVDNGPWNVWKSHFSGTNIVYTGFENHQYAFEVAAYDVAGNWEGFVGTAETITRVVAQLSDREAPPAPTQIMINGKSIPVWSSAADFSISWSQPPDASGIAKVYYKFNTPPQHDTDFDGSESGNPPLNVKAPQQGLIPLYLWLEDGVGNKNIKNIALTFLKFDSDPPEIRQLTVANAVYDSKWLNSDSTTHAQVRLLYSEIHPDSLRYSETLNASPIIEKNQLVGGLEEQIDLLIPIQERNDGCHRFICTLIDSAGNKAIDSLQICLDHTPPVGATATSPQNSTSGRFTVTWADENAGTDPDGSGISGEYDLRLRVGDGSWFEVLNRTTATSFTYVGVHGNAFSFEVAAWDHVGNRELFTGVPETTTIVDTSFVDDAAPSAPLALSVQGRNPSAWQRDPDFEVQWSNPPDPSGISYAYYKFYQPPQNPTDFVDSIAVDHEKGRLVVQTHEEGANILYLWLKDGRGNCNYLNHASIMLRYDATPPIIESISWDQSADSKNWLNQLKTPSIPFQLVFIEDHLDSFTVWNKTVGFYRFDRPQQVARNDTLPFSLDLSRASDGDLTLSAVLQDSAGNKSLPDSVLMHLDSKPPVVTLVSEDSIIMGAEPFRVQVQVVDSNSLAGVNLLYSEGGKRNRSMIPMKETSASHYEATIPESLISARGLEIAILAADSVNQTRYPNEKQVRAIRVRVEGDAQRGLVMPSPLPSGSEENSYRMIAFPLEIDKSSPKDVLTDDIGPYDQQLWRFFYWDAAAPSYQEFNDIVLMNPGQAFWMITTKPEITIDTGPGITVNTTKSFFIILKKGWNDIAVPFNFAVDWKDIISSSAIDTQKIQGPHAYEGRWIYPFENSILQPWQGYSVYSEVDDYSLRMPALEAKSQLSKAAAFGNGSGFEWAMKLCVTSGKAEDAANYFGCAKAATDKWDYGLDYIEAPQVGSYISLYFPHEDWVSSARRFATDIRSSKRGNIWDFEIATNKPDDNVKLTFSPVKNLPKSLALRMVDNEAGVAIDIAADSVYTFKFSKEETIRHFTLYAGDNHFIEEHQEELPATPSEFELVQNYPNPFNSSTIISYRLENATNVNLAVYNLLAQKVRQLQSGHREKGFYQISWNARDDHDIELGTGVYILRLETPEFTSTRKMVYMR